MIGLKGYKIDEKYLRKVSDYQPIRLPRPKSKLQSVNVVLWETGEDK